MVIVDGPHNGYRNLILPHPPLTLRLSRKLYSSPMLQGSLVLGLTRLTPHVNVGLVRPLVVRQKDAFATGWSMGLGLKTFGGGPTLNAEWLTKVADLAVQIKMGLAFGFSGLVAYLQGEWTSSDGQSGVETGVTFSAEGIQCQVV